MSRSTQIHGMCGAACHSVSALYISTRVYCLLLPDDMYCLLLLLHVYCRDGPLQGTQRTSAVRQSRTALQSCISGLARADGGCGHRNIPGDGEQMCEPAGDSTDGTITRKEIRGNEEGKGGWQSSQCARMCLQPYPCTRASSHTIPSHLFRCVHCCMPSSGHADMFSQAATYLFPCRATRSHCIRQAPHQPWTLLQHS